MMFFSASWRMLISLLCLHDVNVHRAETDLLKAHVSDSRFLR